VVATEVEEVDVDIVELVAAKTTTAVMQSSRCTSDFGGNVLLKKSYTVAQCQCFPTALCSHDTLPVKSFFLDP